MKSLGLLPAIIIGMGINSALATEWQIDPDQSHLTFTATQAGSNFDGEFSTFNATISFDPAALDQSSVRVVIKMASATTGNGDRDNALKQPEWFAVDKYPNGVFEARNFVHEGKNHYAAKGTLSLKGTTHKVRLPFRLDVKNGTAHAVGTLKISRQDYHIGTGQWVSGQWIGHQVTVNFDLIATPR